MTMHVLSGYKWCHFLRSREKEAIANGQCYRSSAYKELIAETWNAFQANSNKHHRWEEIATIFLVADRSMELVCLLFVLLKFVPTVDAVTVDRSFEGLTSVPDDIDTNVTRLLMNNNEISAITQSDFNDKYPDLEELKLESNNISSVERGCFRATILAIINLANNRLSSFPDFCQVQTTLREVHLQSNRISTVAAGGISCLTVLETLDLSNNPLLSLPDLSQNLPSLTTLKMQNISFRCCSADACISDLIVDHSPCRSSSSYPSWEGNAWSAINKTQLQNTICYRKTFIMLS
mgnify:CR=1 FL=1